MICCPGCRGPELGMFDRHVPPHRLGQRGVAGRRGCAQPRQGDRLATPTGRGRRRRHRNAVGRMVGMAAASGRAGRRLPGHHRHAPPPSTSTCCIAGAKRYWTRVTPDYEHTVATVWQLSQTSLHLAGRGNATRLGHESYGRAVWRVVSRRCSEDGNRLPGSGRSSSGTSGATATFWVRPSRQR
jgi:hypothetical protein